jgi:hypothetical protein
MKLPLNRVAIVCSVVGWLLGVISLAGLIYFAPGVFQSLSDGSSAAVDSAPRDRNPFYIWLHGINSSVSVLTGIGHGITRAFALASSAGVVLAAFLLRAASGIRAGKRWASLAAVIVLPLLAIGVLVALIALGIV